MIVSQTIGAGTSAFPDTGFRFVDVATTMLAANTEYLIGAFLGSNVDAVIRHTTASTNSGVTLGSTRFDDTGTDFFSAPAGCQGTTYDDGYFGPNSNGLTASAPEPATLILFGLGLAGLGFRRKRNS